VSLFIWLLPFDLSGLGVPAGSYATAGIALGVTEALKLPHHVKVKTPSGENSFAYAMPILCQFEASAYCKEAGLFVLLHLTVRVVAQ